MHKGIGMTFEDPNTEQKVLVTVTEPVTDEDLAAAAAEFIEEEQFLPSKPTEVFVQYAPHCLKSLGWILGLQEKFPSARVKHELLELPKEPESLFRQS